MKENEFVGKVVVSMADSAQIGKVKDLVFRGLQLSALVVKGERITVNRERQGPSRFTVIRSRRQR